MDRFTSTGGGQPRRPAVVAPTDKALATQATATRDVGPVFSARDATVHHISCDATVRRRDHPITPPTLNRGTYHH